MKLRVILFFSFPFIDCLHLGLRACGSWWAGCSSHCLPDPSCWGGFQLSTWTPWQCWFKIGKMICWCPFWCRTAPRPSPRCVSRPTPAATLSTGPILAMPFCIFLWKYWKPLKVSRAALTPFCLQNDCILQKICFPNCRLDFLKHNLSPPKAVCPAEC